ncbi:MAG: methyl-accepting chemotaxis protein [Spirochaetaceae bacterium]|nr:methyl-accepting chemotaxis protein [Spirochaetaceae bacterium]
MNISFFKKDTKSAAVSGGAEKEPDFLEAIEIVKNESKALETKNEELTNFIQGTAASVKSMMDAVEAVRANAEKQSGEVSDSNSGMGKIGEAINTLQKRIEEQADGVNQSSSAVEQMLGNINSVTGTLEQNSKNVQALVTASGTGREGLEAVVNGVSEISAESESLMEINRVMQTIASQTNLLAMNAAIEAAHGGEAGKGFAVVADEIRKLAENSSQQSKTISNEIKKIKASIDNIKAKAGSAMELFAKIVEVISTVATQEEHIRNAMDEQTVGSRQILDAVEKLKNITGDVRAGSEKMLSESATVIQGSSKLDALAKNITESVNHLVKEMQKINADIDRAAEMSALSKVNLKSIDEVSSKFDTGPEPAFRWDSSLVTGNDLIDSEHKTLILAINNFIAAADSNDSGDQLKATLTFLMGYTEKHFSDEEELQKKCNYPNYPNHKKFHEWYKGVVRQTMMDFLNKGSSPELITKAKHDIGDVIIAHIKSEDVRLAAYIKQADGGGGS